MVWHRRFAPSTPSPGVLFTMSSQNGIVTSPPHNSHNCVDPTMNQFRRVWEILLPVTVVMVILLALNFLLLRRAEKRLKAAAKGEDKEVSSTRTIAVLPLHTHLIVMNPRPRTPPSLLPPAPAQYHPPLRSSLSPLDRHCICQHPITSSTRSRSPFLRRVQPFRSKLSLNALPPGRVRKRGRLAIKRSPTSLFTTLRHLPIITLIFLHPHCRSIACP